MPLVSVIIPCFNAARWIEETLRSVLNQSWKEMEVLVIDDGSKDASVAIARAVNDPRIQVYTQPNQGASAARNHGLRRARGDYIQYLDADDLLSPNKLEAQVRRASTCDPRAVLTCSWGRFVHAPEEARFVDQELWRDFSPTEFLREKLKHATMMHPAAWLVPRAVAESAGAWDETLSVDDDGEYFARIVLASAGVVFCPEPRVYYRSGLPGSLSHCKTERAWDSQLRAIALCVDHLLKQASDAATRRVAADALQRNIFDAYPLAKTQRKLLAEKVRQLGGSAIRYEAGPRFQLLRRLLGWKVAKRLRNHWG
jgi:glycosyltransferase involved in cell wall biosynthesis